MDEVCDKVRDKVTVSCISQFSINSYEGEKDEESMFDFGGRGGRDRGDGG